MQTVTSADGTEIAYERHGSGPPLVLVHGGSATKESWRGVVPHLAEDFTVYVPDRRGRGDSGDAEAYSLEREVEDLRAVVEAVADAHDRDPAVVGHSFGGLVALAAAPDLAVDRYVLYEPAVLVGEYRDDDLAARMQARLEDGDRRGAMRLFIEEGSGVPDATALPFWPDEVNFDLAETVVRENHAVESFALPAELDVGAPALVLTGERSAEHLRAAARTIDDRLADSHLVELEGVGHTANAEAPERFATEIRQFVATADSSTHA